MVDRKKVFLILVALSIVFATSIPANASQCAEDCMAQVGGWVDDCEDEGVYTPEECELFACIMDVSVCLGDCGNLLDACEDQCFADAHGYGCAQDDEECLSEACGYLYSCLNACFAVAPPPAQPVEPTPPPPPPPPLPPGCTFSYDVGLESGYLFPNMFICPYDPLHTEDEPPCPEQIYVDSWYPAHVTAGEYQGMQVYGETHYQRSSTKWVADNESHFTIVWENIGDACYQGKEGQYYIWFQVTDQTAGTILGSSDGYCFKEAYIVDWDDKPEKYCREECVGYQVNSMSGLECCGDDNLTSDDGADCLKGSGGYLCIKTGDTWEWFDVYEQTGRIKELSCADVSIVSDGEDFLRCAISSVPNEDTTNSFYFTYIEKGGVYHAYACFLDVDGNKRIAECSGAGAAFSLGGVKKDPGESILSATIFGNITYYCLMHREIDNSTEWVTDLDNISSENWQDCQDAKLHDGSSAGHIWTGTKCCSEADDDEEYYNDREGYNETYTWSGGCWNKQYVPAGTISVDIINYKGGFEGCNITEGDPVLEINDSHTGEQLVNNNDFCTVLEDAQGYGNHLFCSFSGNWVQSDAVGLQMKTTEWDDSTGCCGPMQCWSGSECIDDQYNSSMPTTYHGYRCIHGEWDETKPLKFTWDRSESGYCPSDLQCLVSPSAAANCINSGEYVDKKYCEDGGWTSRTKLLAIALLRYANLMSPEDYTLFCDTYDNILTYYNYQVGGDYVLNYLGEIHCQGKPCVNEFCVLKYSDGIALGTSVNELIDSTKSFLKALNQSITLCNNAKINDNQYHRCSNSNIWYNHRQGTVIQLPTDDILTAVSWRDAFITFIKSPFETIKSWIVPKTTGLEFFNQTRMFTKIYADVHGTKKVFAFLEEEQTIYINGWPMSNVDYLGLEYHGLDMTPCSLIRHYDQTISCTADQTIFAQSRRPGQRNLVDAWPDLTAKLRVR